MSEANRSMPAEETFGIGDIRAAVERIRPYIHHTPVMRARSIDALLDAEIFFKCENLQKVGAFKFRGASNAVLSLADVELERGVATHSSGNHAAALALAAQQQGASCLVVMPNDANAAKKAAVEHYGAEIVLCEPGLLNREQTLAAIAGTRGLTTIPPFDDYRVIAGQGTAALELLSEAQALDSVIAPVGGGGLLAGTAVAVGTTAPRVTVIGAEPAQADDAYRSLAARRLIPVSHPDTIADGLRTSLGTLTFPLIAAHVEGIVRVSERTIVDAMRLIWERMKLVVEPSAAVALAACLEEPERFRGQRIGVILSGGNVDLNALPFD